MAVALRGTPTWGEGSGGSIVINKPTGVVDGDFLIAWGVVNASTISAVPTGWQLEWSEAPGGGANSFYVYSKLASSEGSSWSWTLSGFPNATMGVAAYSGVDTSNLHDVATTSVGSPGSGSAVIPGNTTVTDNAWFVTVAMQVFGGAGVGWTAPSGFTKDAERTPSTASNSIVVGHKNITPAGATGSSTWTNADTGNSKAGAGIFLRPAGGGGGGTDTSPPTFTWATNTAGTQIIGTTTDTLDTASVPATSAFTPKVNTVARGVTNVAVATNTVTLTLASAITSGQTVTVSLSP